MEAPGFIASRLRFRDGLAVSAIAISFFVIIVAVAVSGGFRSEIMRLISESSGDIQLTGSGSLPFDEGNPIRPDSLMLASLRSLPQVEKVETAVYRAGIVRHDEAIQGVLVKGTDDPSLGQMAVRIPVRLSRLLGLAPGDVMTTYFVGEKVRARNFKVAGIYESIVTAEDYPVVLANAADIRRVNGWSEDETSAVEVVLKERHRTAEGLSQATWETGTRTSLVPLALDHRYPQIFGWLSLVDFNVLMILILMTVVAAFNMISGLLIMLFRSISTIGILKSMGMTDRTISGVFLRVASRIVLIGMAVGNGLALLFCIVQKHTRLLALDPENYFVSFVPVKMNLPMMLVTDFLAYAAIMLLMLLPTLFISRVDPARTVRAS